MNGGETPVVPSGCVACMRRSSVRDGEADWPEMVPVAESTENPAGRVPMTDQDRFPTGFAAVKAVPEE